MNSDERTAFISVVPTTAGVLSYPTFSQAGPVIQIFFLTALHTAEQLTNLHRDETSWCAMLKLDAKQWGYCWKEVDESYLHCLADCCVVDLEARGSLAVWSIIFCGADKEDHHPSYALFALAGIAFLLTVFASELMYRQPKGPQPTINGNLKILVGFMNGYEDDGDKGGRLEGAIQ